MDGSINVAVRVRPANQRERAAQSADITQVSAQNIEIRDPATRKTKNFTFSHCFGPQTTQEEIYQSVGSRAVTHILEGYNCTIFAYGQTSSGKTFTMMGDDQAPGLIPRIMRELFARLAARESLASISYAEIYIEQIFDLLGGKRESLHVREHPVLGPYVEGLKQTAVESAEQAMQFIAAGNRHRSTCETAMNHDSSRSHAIVTLQLNIRTAGKEIQSRLAMVDLAGSERIFDSGVQGIHKQEALKINKSLSALSKVIKQLSEKQTHISYRDSSLTFLLKDSLGGNSLTYMIAACSPAALNYAETLNTLRYAASAMRIVNRPKINERSDEAVVAILEREIEDLRKELAKHRASASSELISRLQQDIHDREHLMREREKSWEERLAESQKLQRENEEEIKSLSAELDRATPITALAARLDALDARFDKIDTRLDEITASVTLLSTKIDEMMKLSNVIVARDNEHHASRRAFLAAHGTH